MFLLTILMREVLNQKHDKNKSVFISLNNAYKQWIYELQDELKDFLLPSCTDKQDVTKS